MLGLAYWWMGSKSVTAEPVQFISSPLHKWSVWLGLSRLIKIEASLAQAQLCSPNSLPCCFMARILKHTSPEKGWQRAKLARFIMNRVWAEFGMVKFLIHKYIHFIYYICENNNVPKKKNTNWINKALSCWVSFVSPYLVIWWVEPELCLHVTSPS